MLVYMQVIIEISPKDASKSVIQIVMIALGLLYTFTTDLAMVANIRASWISVLYGSR
jgi:hypothetical protein